MDEEEIKKRTLIIRRKNNRKTAIAICFRSVTNSLLTIKCKLNIHIICDYKFPLPVVCFFFFYSFIRRTLMLVTRMYTTYKIHTCIHTYKRKNK